MALNVLLLIILITTGKTIRSVRRLWERLELLGKHNGFLWNLMYDILQQTVGLCKFCLKWEENNGHYP